MLREKWLVIALGTLLVPLAQTDAFAVDILCPIPIPARTELVNGVAVTVTGKTYRFDGQTCFTQPLSYKVIADLSDLQRKIPQIVARIPLPQDNCANFGLNPVVSISNPRLTPSNYAGHWIFWWSQIYWGHTDVTEAVFETNGKVVIWECIKGPPKITVVYKDHCIKVFGRNRCIRVPVGVTTSPGRPIKTILATQPFLLLQPFTLRRASDESVEVVPGRLELHFVGVYGDMMYLVLGIFISDLNAILNKSATAFLDPKALFPKLNLPGLPLNLKIYDATFTRVPANSANLGAALLVRQ